MINSKRIYSLDFFKFFASIGIVLIHCKFPGTVGGTLRVCGKVGVPFFMMISGFFSLYGEQNNVDRNKILKKIKHILTILLGASLFYAAIHFILICLWGGISPLTEFYNQITVKKVIKLLVQCSPFVYSHLWFLIALIYCYLFVLLLGRKIKGNWKICFVVVSLLLFTVMSELLPKFGISLQISQYGISIYNIFIFRALPFYMIGMLFRENVDCVSSLKISCRQLILLMIIGLIIAVVEKIMLTESQFYIGTYITAISIFVFCIKFPASINRRIEFIGSEITMYVYIIHVGVMEILDYIASGLNIGNIIIWQWMCPVFVILLSLLVAYLFELSVFKSISHTSEK